MSDELPLPRVTFIDQAGDRLAVEARVGDSAMETAKRHRIPGIRGDCGGFMQCATCHVYVDDRDLDDLPPVGDIEDEMLDGAAAERRATSRLSCQIAITATTDLHLALPNRQL